MQLPAPFGKYELLERIATGGMAEVFLARSFGVAGFEKRLVIKRLRPELAEDPRFVSMFIAEAKIGVHLNHPNVVQVYELGKVGAAHYIAMEHLHGKDLTRIVKMLRFKEERLELPLAVAIMAEICRGLAYAHGRTDADGTPLGLVHRDVSPHNILVTFTGEVKLVDFGIARLATTVGAQKEGTDKKPGPGGGKYAYMSPEQAEGRSLDHRSDLFSAGIVLWELIVGQRLYQDSNHDEKLRRVREAVIPHPATLGVPVDDALWGILQKALAKDPADRYSAAALLEEDLRAWLFEKRHRVGRAEIATLARDTFPEEADRPGDVLQLRQLVADVDRLEHSDRTHSDPGTGRTPMPGRLRPPLGERRPVVVVMVDVDGLTELSSTVEPETLVRRKYQLLRWARRIVDRHGGLIQRAVDDHITILFGVPRSRTDDLAHALECALEMHRNVGQLRKKGMVVELAIGVHTGEVTVSQAGKRIRYVARGDTTRLARRLSAVADHGQTLISERVLGAVEGWFRVRYGPNVPSRGGRDALPSYLVEGRAHGLRGAQTGAWLRRGDELDILRASLVRLASGQGTALALVGGMGCGKSRFIREIRELATRRATTFLGVRCTALGTERPLEPIRDLVASVLCGDPDASLDELTQACSRLPQLGLSERDVSAIVALIGAKGAQTFERGETWQAVGRMLRGLAADRRLIVAFDDAQHLPASWWPDLAHLVRSLADIPVLFLLSLVGEHVSLELEDVAQIVRLGSLTRELQVRFVESRLRVEQVDGSLLGLIERSCEGNPLYIEEMLKYLMGAGRITIESGRAVLAGAGSAGLPHSLQALITARIDALDSASRGLLQLAAVAGETFDEKLLGEAAGVPDPAPWLLDLVSHGLLVREPGAPEQWSFSSALVREAALRGTLGVQRRDYHRLIAAAMEHVYRDRLDSVLEALVTHCAEGGRLVDAARYAFQVGQRYEREQYLDQARAFYQQGLQHLVVADKNPDEWDARIQGEAMLNLRLGVVLLLLGDVTEAHRRLVLALDIASETGLPWIESRAHVALGRSHLAEGRIEVAAAHLSQAEEALRIEPDVEVERETVETAAQLAYGQGRYEDAEHLWQRALALSEDDPAARARCEIGLANRYLRSGEHDRARELLEHALGTARASQDRITEGRVLNNIGLVHSWAGRHAMALHYYRAALELREGIGYTRGVVVNHHNIGDVHFHSGEYAKAWVSFQRSRELAEEIGWERGVALNDVFIAFLDARQGRADVDAILSATERARSFGDHEIVATGLWLAGRYYLERSRTDLAETHLTQALSEARRISLEPMIQVLEESLRTLHDGVEATAPG
jgi:serine/threonine protein kinase/tetratricopeptide (TPR) repeat protein